MATLLKGFITVTFIILSIDYGYGSPRVCYNCLTAATGAKKPCNDPVDTNAIGIIDCLSLTTTTSGLFNFSDADIKAQSDSTISTVCAKASYLQNGILMTLRTCSPKTVDGKETCAAFKANAGSQSGVTDIKCTTCTSNLCNSSTSIYASLLILTITGFMRMMV